MVGDLNGISRALWRLGRRKAKAVEMATIDDAMMMGGQASCDRNCSAPRGPPHSKYFVLVLHLHLNMPPVRKQCLGGSGVCTSQTNCTRREYGQYWLGYHLGRCETVTVVQLVLSSVLTVWQHKYRRVRTTPSAGPCSIHPLNPLLHHTKSQVPL
jgi:hypothetical protein